MNKYLDDNGLLYLWSKIKNAIPDVSGKVNSADLGTAAAKNVPQSGNASSGEVVLGNDTRLTDSRNAADVSAWAKAANKPSYTASEVGAISQQDKGVANGVATLDSTGKIPSSQLPSYVDDVVETYGISGTTALTGGWLSTTDGGSALTPETGKIYVLMADFPTTNPTHYANSQYRWSGSAYVQIYDSGVTSITNSEIDTIVAS